MRTSSIWILVEADMAVTIGNTWATKRFSLAQSPMQEADRVPDRRKAENFSFQGINGRGRVFTPCLPTTRESEMNKRLILSLITAVTLTACAGMKGSSAPAMADGGVLVTFTGMTLYTFDADPAGSEIGRASCRER